MNREMTPVVRAVHLDVDWDFESPDFRPLVDRPERLPEELQRDTYYDTRDLRLWARGLVLRRRRALGSDIGEWTLRTPVVAKDGSAAEALFWIGENGRVPAEANAILHGVVRRSALTVVAEFDATRRRLVMAAGREEDPWGELVDDLTLVQGGANAGTRFRRIGLRLWPGYPEVADSVLDLLQSSGAEVTEQHRLAFVLGDAYDQARPRTRGRHRTLDDLIHDGIAAGLDRLLDHDYRVRMDFASAPPRDVHQMRVAARRLRSDLRTFGSNIDPIWMGHTITDLRWLGAALGRVRDCDVMASRFQAGLDRSQATGQDDSGLLGRLSEQRRSAAEQLGTVMNEDRYLDLLDRLHASLDGPLPAMGDMELIATEALPALVWKRWRSLRRRVRKGGERPTDRDLHRVRIAAKRLRYAAEASVPDIDKPASRTATAAEKVQTVLGELHDSVGAVQWLETQSTDPTLTRADAFTAGILSRDENLQQTHLRACWASDWKKFKRKRNRAWLHK
jgi:CHAD domain-containing protein